MTLTYGQLPQRGNGHGLSIRCTNPECSQFLVAYSPDRGDYWYMPDDAPVTCGTCCESDALMRESTTLEEVEQDA